MTWREKDHPRHDDGRFRDKIGGWVSAVSDRLGLPSARDMVMAPSGTDFRQVAEALEGHYGRDGQMVVSDVAVYKVGGDDPDGAHMWPAPHGHVEISGAITSADGTGEGGYFRVTLSRTRKNKESDPLRWTGYIDRMHVHGTAQGGGGGRELTDRLIEWMRRSGFDEVGVGPSEVGSYAWPAMGFDFGDWEDRKIAWEGAMTMTVESVRQWFSYGGYGLDDSDLTDAEIKRMIRQYQRAASLALAGGMSAKRLSQVGRRKGQGKNDVWAGKLGLLVGGIGSGRIKL